jgi:V/A-type H+-transporting ATPase subunit E
MANTANATSVPSQGIDALIAKLREEGVAAGRGEGEKIVAEARTKAKQLVDKAHEEARGRLETSRKEAEAFQAAAEAAIKTAMRDALLDMKARLMQRFSADVKRLVSQSLQDEEFLQRIILEVAGRARERIEAAGAEDLEIILPDKVVGLEELRKKPEELQKGRLTQFVLGLSGETLREGVTFAASDELESGVRIRMVKDDITLDLTDEAIAGLLLQHLQPRFRAILEGIVK